MACLKGWPEEGGSKAEIEREREKEKRKKRERKRKREERDRERERERATSGRGGLGRLQATCKVRSMVSMVLWEPLGRLF